jgi:MFS family permease
MNRNVALLVTSQAFLMTGNVLLASTAALVGLALAPRPGLATLPVAVYFLTQMATTVPASLMMRRTGRRVGFAAGAAIGTAGAVLAVFALLQGSFGLFCLAEILMGVFNSFGGYYRFAATEAVAEPERPRAVSYVLAGGIVAAVLGGTLANATRTLLSVEFAGCYLALAGTWALAIASSSTLTLVRPTQLATGASGRPLGAIARQPVFVVAAASAMIGYAAMVLLMTATPLAMRAHAHPFGVTAFVIQLHVLGMFAPSFFTGGLIARFGTLKVMLAGSLFVLAAAATGLAGTSTAHFLIGLFALGIGWNFLYVGATSLLTEAYAPEEAAKTQALNDFLVLSAVAAASLTAGFAQAALGWDALNLAVIPFVVAVMGILLWLGRRRRQTSLGS